MTAALVIVGAGPRGTGLLERIGANAPEVLGAEPLTVHLVDPHPPGGGRLWRREQSELLWMNSMAQDVTMFLDSTVDSTGPVRTGPTLSEWAQHARDLESRGLGGPLDSLPAELAEQVRQLHGRTFASRQVQSAYLAWVFDRAVAQLPDTVTVRVHPTSAEAVRDDADGRQRVWLADTADPLVADVVVLAMGHLDAEPSREQQELLESARRTGSFYLPPEHSTEEYLDAVRPGADVLLRGFGLGFVDLMVLLTEGRGGQYKSEEDGSLTYVASGREPRLHVGSRRGVPYRSKIGYGLLGDRPPLPAFFGPERIDALPAGADFGRDVWPLIAKELGWAHYHELFAGHPERTCLPWAEFAARYTEAVWGSAEMDELIRQAVPSAEDRLDLAALDRPLAGQHFADPEEFQRWMRGHIRSDVDRKADQGRSADLGMFLGLLSVFGQLPALLASGKLDARSQVRELDGWWFGFFNYVASGPPGPRLEQLLALSRAGIVRFLGPGMWVRADESGFRAGSSGVAGEVRASALIEATLPAPTVRRSRNPLLRDLHRRGAGVPETLTGGDFHHETGRLLVAPGTARVIDAAGREHPRRYALGPYTSERAMAAFARPRSNAPVFRRNDATARTILGDLRGLPPEFGATRDAAPIL